ncbi:MAG TPA: hypothetical protein VFG73_00510 [Rhodanobacteraceae bacterium]|nr:hypothetical protein [Rhodanobacteraceae bacterium]
MNAYDKTPGMRALGQGMGAGLRWRFLLLWIVLSWIPAAVIGWPVWQALGGVFDHAVPAAGWAAQFHWMELDGIFGAMGHSAGALQGATTVAFIFTLLLSPLLTGMAIASGRSAQSPGLGELLHGGLLEYWRMVRIGLWSLIPLGIALIIGSIALNAADRYADTAVLESQARLAVQLAWVVFGIVFVIAHAGVEAGRAQFVAEPGLRSGLRALSRGYRQLLRRPLASFGIYLAASIIGIVVLLALAMLRTRVNASGVGGFIAAFLVTQAMVAVVAWMRASRLIGLGGIAGRRGMAPSASYASVPRPRVASIA